MPYFAVNYIFILQLFMPNTFSFAKGYCFANVCSMDLILSITILFFTKMLKTIVLLNIYRILWKERSKVQHLFEIEIFCNIINVTFTVTFNQLNVSLLNEMWNVFAEKC